MLSLQYMLPIVHVFPTTHLAFPSGGLHLGYMQIFSVSDILYSTATIHTAWPFLNSLMCSFSPIAGAVHE